MKKYLLTAYILVLSQPLYASIMSHFRLEDGHTDWQHVANWSSGIFIILLSATAITLFFSRREARRSNHELKLIRLELEQRVLERTATLDESNKLLQESNKLLEGEINQHRETTAQLRSSEAYITDILRSMPLMLIGLDENGNITQWNQRAEDITGIPPTRALGSNLWQIYPAITITQDQINEAQASNQRITIKHSQRGQYHFDITIYPLQEQRETGVVVLIDDVTEHILAANMLIQRDKMSSMGELASTMAHDISAPLQIILEDLKKSLDQLENTNTKNDQDIETIIKKITNLLADADLQGKQVLAVTNNLLEFSHSHGGKKQLTDIPKIIDNTLKLANDVISVPSGLRFKDITIERDYGENLPQIPGFISELQQVFLSLFRHACHALGEAQQPGDLSTIKPDITPTIKPTIKIQVIECYDALWIKVQHNGLGVSNEEQKFIFEPFFTNTSSDNGASDNDYDAGKRLSFSHFIITEQHRGQLAITSDMNVGTTFHIQLPLE